MKKLLLSLSFIATVIGLQAQTDSTLSPLQEYTGKYKFPDGNPVTEITVTIDNGTLQASSAIGTTEFKKTDTKDVFDIVAYSGTATFKRNAEGKITGLRIQVQDLDMEGTKSEGKLQQFIHGDRLLLTGR